MKAASFLPKQLGVSVGRLFSSRPVAPIIAVLLEPGEERLRLDVERELIATGRIVSVNTVAELAAAESRIEA